MASKLKSSGKAHSIPGGMAIAAAVSISTTVIMSGMTANMLNIEKIAWEKAGYWIMAMLFMSSFLGAKCAFWTIKRQRLAISLISGGLYWGILLLVTALFFGGKYESVFETAAIILAGSGSAALIYRPKKNASVKTRRKAYR